MFLMVSVSLCQLLSDPSRSTRPGLTKLCIQLEVIKKKLSKGCQRGNPNRSPNMLVWPIIMYTDYRP